MLFDNHRNVKFFNIWKNGKMKTNNWKYIKKLEQEIYILNQVLNCAWIFISFDVSASTLELLVRTVTLGDFGVSTWLHSKLNSNSNR